MKLRYIINVNPSLTESIVCCRNMSSKRKSPPSKLQEGSGPVSGEDGGEVTQGGGEGSDLELENSRQTATPQAAMEALAPSPRADLAASLYFKMTSQSPGSEPRTPPPHSNADPAMAPPSMFYKLSSTSSSSGASGSEVEDDLVSPPPNKRKREDSHGSVNHAEECARYYQMKSLPKPVMTPNSLQALLALNQSSYLEERILSPPRRSKAGRESPSEADKKTTLLHLNNNSTTLNHNNSGGKRTMDDVLKRLTNKMNNSTIREERRSGSPPKLLMG